MALNTDMIFLLMPLSRTTIYRVEWNCHLQKYSLVMGQKVIVVTLVTS